MIEVLPMADREQEKSLLGKIEEAGDKARVLMMKERGSTLGYVAVEILEDELKILKIEAEGYDFTEKPTGETVFILDTLMRSAASFGETFGADKIATVFPDFYGFFKNRGFDTDDTHAFTPMSTIVKYE